MDKKFYYGLGTIFITTSGILYTIERVIAYFSWVGQMNAHTGSFPIKPSLPGLLTNAFIPMFIIIGIYLFVSGYRKK